MVLTLAHIHVRNSSFSDFLRIFLISWNIWKGHKIFSISLPTCLTGRRVQVALFDSLFPAFLSVRRMGFKTSQPINQPKKTSIIYFLSTAQWQKLVLENICFMFTLYWLQCLLFQLLFQLFSIISNAVQLQDSPKGCSPEAESCCFLFVAQHWIMMVWTGRRGGIRKLLRFLLYSCCNGSVLPSPTFVITLFYSSTSFSIISYRLDRLISEAWFYFVPKIAQLFQFYIPLSKLGAEQCGAALPFWVSEHALSSQVVWNTIITFWWWCFLSEKFNSTFSFSKKKFIFFSSYLLHWL